MKTGDQGLASYARDVAMLGQGCADQNPKLADALKNLAHGMERVAADRLPAVLRTGDELAREEFPRDWGPRYFSADDPRAQAYHIEWARLSAAKEKATKAAEKRERVAKLEADLKSAKAS